MSGSFVPSIQPRRSSTRNESSIALRLPCAQPARVEISVNARSRKGGKSFKRSG
jgi:hypothetical protein